MPNEKAQLTQEEFEEQFEIIEPKEEGDNRGKSNEVKAPPEDDTTPEFLTEEEQEHDDKLFESLNFQEEDK